MRTISSMNSSVGVVNLPRAVHAPRHRDMSQAARRRFKRRAGRAENSVQAAHLSKSCHPSRKTHTQFAQCRGATQRARALTPRLGSGPIGCPKGEVGSTPDFWRIVRVGTELVSFAHPRVDHRRGERCISARHHDQARADLAAWPIRGFSRSPTPPPFRRCVRSDARGPSYRGGRTPARSHERCHPQARETSQTSRRVRTLRALSRGFPWH
jgi:hypothetical protein